MPKRPLEAMPGDARQRVKVERAEKGSITDAPALRAAFASALKDETLADVVFVVEGQRFPAGRLILAARSEMFKIMLLGHFKESNEKEITLDNIGAAEFKIILEWIYTGSADITLEESITLQKHADYFMLPDLKEKCKEHVAKSLTSKNALKLLEQSIKYCDGISDTSEAVLRCIAQRASSVALDPSWLSLSSELLIKILSLGILNIDEDLLYDRTVLWIGRQAKSDGEKKALTEQVLQHICFARMSEKYLGEKVGPLVETCGGILKDRYAAALEYKLLGKVWKYPLRDALIPPDSCGKFFYNLPGQVLRRDNGGWIELFRTNNFYNSSDRFPGHEPVSAAVAAIVAQGVPAPPPTVKHVHSVLSQYKKMCMGIYYPDSPRIRVLAVGHIPREKQETWNEGNVAWRFQSEYDRKVKGCVSIVCFGRLGANHVTNRVIGEFDDGFSLYFGPGLRETRCRSWMFLYASDQD